MFQGWVQKRIRGRHIRQAAVREQTREDSRYPEALAQRRLLCRIGGEDSPPVSPRGI